MINFHLSIIKILRHLEIATGGWGSNEAVVNAMQRAIFWSVLWKASFSGGLFILDLKHDQVHKRREKNLDFRLKRLIIRA